MILLFRKLSRPVPRYMNPLKIGHYVRRFQEMVRARGLGRTFGSVFVLMGMTRKTANLNSARIKRCLGLFEYIRRRKVETVVPLAGAHPIPESLGYAILDANRIEGLKDLVSHCRSILEREQERLSAPDNVETLAAIEFHRTPWGVEIGNPKDVRPIIDVLAQPYLVATAARYIGEIPVLGNICLLHTPIHDVWSGPQLFHRDMNQDRQLHLIIAINDIDETAGPFTFVPAHHSARINKSLGHTGGRITDEDMYKYLNPEDCIQFTGGAGSALMVNPYQCFHFGGRAEKRTRQVLICSYTSKFEGAEEAEGIYTAVNRSALDDNSRLRKLLLDL